MIPKWCVFMLRCEKSPNELFNLPSKPPPNLMFKWATIYYFSWCSGLPRPLLCWFHLGSPMWLSSQSHCKPTVFSKSFITFFFFWFSLYMLHVQLIFMTSGTVISIYGGNTKFHFLKMQGLPWWRSGWESACECRGHGFGPWSGRIPHAAERLGPWATTIEPARLEPVLCNRRGRDSERPVHRGEEWPPLAATRESPHTETKT